MFKDFLLSKKFIYFLFLFFSIVFYFFITFFSSTSDNQRDTALVVGTNSGFPPYELINEHGELEGFDIDVARSIAAKMGKKLEIKDMSFDALIISLKQGKIDLILAGMSITKSRLKEIEMIHYHGKSFNLLPLVFWKQIPQEIKSIYDLKKHSNKTVCVQAGTIQEEFVSKFDFLNVKNLELVSDLIMEIKYGKSIACLLEPYVVSELKSQIPEIQVLNVVLDEKDQSFGHGIGIKRENASLVKQVKSIVDELKANKDLDNFAKKWFTKKG